MSWPIYNELFWELLPSKPPPFLKFLIAIFLWLEMRQRKREGGQRLMMNDFVIIILSRPGGKDSY